MAVNTVPSLPTGSRSRRKCGSCAFFQPSPLRHQGWCRNPILHDPHELALVSNDEHRCLQMLNDHWEPGSHVVALPAVADTERQRIGKAKPVAPKRSMSILRFAPPPLAYAMVVLLVAVVAAVVFSTQTTRATNDVKPTKNQAVGMAKVDFWIRDEPRSDALKKSIVLLGTSLELIDSKAGEELEGATENPGKWYRIRVAATGETGWVYSGWIDRRQ